MPRDFHPSRRRDVLVFAAFWLAAVALLRVVVAPRSDAQSFLLVLLAAFVLALLCFAVAVLGLRAHYSNAWARSLRIAYGVVGICVVAALFFGGAIVLGQWLR